MIKPKKSENNTVSYQKITNFIVSAFKRKSFYTALSFAAVPSAVYFTVNGSIFGYIPQFLFLVSAFFLAGILLCAKDRGNIKGFAVFSVFMLAAFGSAFLSYFRCTEAAEILAEKSGGAPVRISGYIDCADAESAGVMYVKIISADGEKLKIPVTAQGFNHSGHFLQKGAYVELDAVLQTAEKDGKYTQYMYSKGAYCRISSFKNLKTNYRLDRLSVSSEMKSAVFGGVLSVLENISGKERFDRAVSLAKSLMFGDKSGFSDEMLSDFSRSGLTHILCVSGLHFSVMLGGVSYFLNRTVKKRRIRGALLFAVSIAYLSMCGFAKSAVRAGVMALISALSLSGVKYRALNTLLLAVSLICIAAPNAVFDTSFRLSVLSCIGICGSQRILAEISERLEYRPILRFCALMASMSLGAFAFVFPYLLCAFGGTSTVSVFSSIAAVFPAQICLIVCWCSFFASLLGVRLVNMLFAGAISALSDYICSAAHFFSSMKSLDN